MNVTNYAIRTDKVLDITLWKKFDYIYIFPYPIYNKYYILTRNNKTYYSSLNSYDG